jgi:hypothetical protein
LFGSTGPELTGGVGGAYGAAGFNGTGAPHGGAGGGR